MKTIDLSHTMSHGMPVFPGDGDVEFSFRGKIETHGFTARFLKFSSHVGTHVDAPAHLIPDGLTLADLPLDSFVGPGCRLDLTAGPPRTVDLSHLEAFESAIAESKFLLLQTGWSRYWGRPDYLGDFPVLDPKAAEWLVQQGLKGLGVDTISVDPVDSTSLVVHRRLLSAGLVIYENLTNLAALPDQGFLFMGLPLKIESGDGSPVRAAALVY